MPSLYKPVSNNPWGYFLRIFIEWPLEESDYPSPPSPKVAIILPQENLLTWLFINTSKGTKELFSSMQSRNLRIKYKHNKTCTVLYLWHVDILIAGMSLTFLVHFNNQFMLNLMRQLLEFFRVDVNIRCIL